MTSATVARRLHYQSQVSNVSNQSFLSNTNETTNFNESFASVTLSGNPLITIIYANALLTQENQQLLLNSYASCRRLLDHMKQVVGISQDETIDLMDNEGKVKELNTHFDEYATQYLTARSTYYVLKVEIDTVTGEKRYTPSFNIDQIDQKLNIILTNSLNMLNKAMGKTKRPTGTTRQNTTVQSSTSTPQTKSRKSSSRKQN